MQERRSLSVPKFHRGGLGLFLVSVALSFSLSKSSFSTYFLLQTNTWGHGQNLWAPLSANFVCPTGQLIQLLGTLVFQWLFGSLLEPVWGTKRYVTYVLGCGILGYLLTACLGLIPGVSPALLGGPIAMDMAVVAAFGVTHARSQSAFYGVIPMSGGAIALFIIGLGVMSALLQSAPWISVMPYVFSSGLGALWVYRQGKRKMTARKLVSVRKNHLNLVN